jgi:hypothetical protein
MGDLVLLRPPAGGLASCSACSWEGAAVDLGEREAAAISPGDICPAGCCPDCGAIAYLLPTRAQGPAGGRAVISIGNAAGGIALSSDEAAAIAGALSYCLTMRPGLMSTVIDPNVLAEVIRLLREASGGDAALRQRLLHGVGAPTDEFGDL